MPLVRPLRVWNPKQSGTHGLLVLLASLTAILFAAGILCGQAIPICDKPPDLGGQWAGPWDLREQINRGPNPPRFSEIVHAVLLPPPNEGWMLVWCARYCQNIEADPGPASRPYETFLWRASDPGTVVRVAVPTDPPFGSDDLFCGGQLVTPEGLVIVFGGTDIQATCYNDEEFTKGHAPYKSRRRDLGLRSDDGLGPEFSQCRHRARRFDHRARRSQAAFVDVSAGHRTGTAPSTRDLQDWQHDCLEGPVPARPSEGLPLICAHTCRWKNRCDWRDRPRVPGSL